jgi:hypothetical protein
VSSYNIYIHRKVNTNAYTYMYILSLFFKQKKIDQQFRCVIECTFFLLSFSLMLCVHARAHEHINGIDWQSTVVWLVSNGTENINGSEKKRENFFFFSKRFSFSLNRINFFVLYVDHLGIPTEIQTI